MAEWNKKNVTKNQIEPLCRKYGISQILSSIFVRRGITKGKDILYYLEDDLRFQHQPFLLPNIEDAVERILQAEEEGEKVLIFGDSDTDGVTSTAILYGYLKKRGMDVSWRVPVANEPYGLSIQAVDDFAAQNGTLIITVDCGISNFNEVRHAAELGIDVIITDHHNPQGDLPEAIVIIDPKLPDSIYPFKDISGAAVAYKLVSALRFSHTDFYNSEITILEVSDQDERDGSFTVECVKIKNLVKEKELSEKLIPGRTTIYETKLLTFLQGQILYAWDKNQTKARLEVLFGRGIDFNINDLRSQVSQSMPSLKSKSSSQIKDLSSIAKYLEDDEEDINAKNSTIESLYNLYVSWVRRLISSKHPDFSQEEAFDLQLTGLAALADIMPMKNENRIFVSQCLASIKKDGPRSGLAELFAKFRLLPQAVTSTDLSWNIIPAINAAGRLGNAKISADLLLCENAREREKLSDEIYMLNEKRKQIVQETSFKVHDKAEQSVKEHQNKFCVVVDEEINKGLTGLFAARLMSDFGLPSFAITFTDDICIGSVRSRPGFIATDFLDSMKGFFLNHGGHNYAAGFSFEKEKLPLFLQNLKNASQTLSITPEDDSYDVDAEIPPAFLEPSVFSLLDVFEPYGNENAELLFMTKKIKVCDAAVVGKKEPFHLKLTLDCGKYKFPAMFWSQAERLKKDIAVGKSYDILYTLTRNYFNGSVTNQLVIKELKASD